MGALVRTTAIQVPVVQKEEAQYLTFLLGSEMFAIDILGIKEIIEYGSLTSVPMMPEFIRGRDQPARRSRAGGRPVGPLWPCLVCRYPAQLHRHHRGRQ